MPSFRARIELIGINPFVRVPAVHLKALLRSAGRSTGPIPIVVTIEGAPFAQNLVVYQGEWRLYLNLPMRKRAGKDLGDRIALRVEFDPSPPQELMTPELARALDQHEPAQQAFLALAPSRRKEILRYLNRLRTASTLQTNVDKVIHYLLGGEPSLAVLRPRAAGSDRGATRRPSSAAAASPSRPPPSKRRGGASNG
ncbi:MAG TPA: YdeI/OmpD-associated family protein [Polyangiaceae bacterium]|nr:YdeI/OmpD-associated family protein [Polyangiaceae bacterium]